MLTENAAHELTYFVALEWEDADRQALVPLSMQESPRRRVVNGAGLRSASPTSRVLEVPTEEIRAAVAASAVGRGGRGPD